MTDPNNKRHYRQVILDRSKNPRHQGQTNPIDRRERGHNPSCGDTIELTLALNEAGIEIADIKFEGIGCALCLASADFMAGAVKGIRLEEALLLVEQFRQLLIEQAQFSPPLDKLNIFQGVSQYPIRIKCATLPWHTLKAAILSNSDCLSSS